ncbi:MAG: efflux transporter outer membrane subunit [Blastochloris sp.]|nr:efflux transporter outer membrane subunit [Blastochloris sp.]
MRPPFTHFLMLLLPCLLAACAMGPNYERPTVDTPPDWRWKKAEPRDAEPKGPWWEKFNDPALNQLQADAALGNQDLKAALARIDQSRAQARVSQADFFPQLSTSPAWQRYRTSGNTASRGGFPNSSTTANDMSIPFDLSYEIDLWGKVRRGFEAARNQMLAQTAAYQNVLFTLQSNIASTYYQIRAVDREINLLEQAVQLRQDSVALFQARFDAGYTNELDVTSTKTVLASAKAELADAKRRRAVLQNALAVLSGRAPSQFDLPPALVSIDPPQVSPGLPSELLERRPDVAEAERILAARNAEIGVAYAAFFPSIRLTAQGGFQSAELRDLFEWESRIWSFGPSINLPIFSGGRLNADLKQTRAAYEEAVATYRQTILVAFQETDDALAALRFLSEQAEAQREAVTSARKSADISIARYRNGVVDYLDVIDAERTRLDNELAVVRVDRERMISTILLIKAIGGGWSGPATPNSVN